MISACKGGSSKSITGEPDRRSLRELGMAS
jgi:hypothetical protein